ncbi:hypothetical protein NDU88_006917 [Pleurodeles waltl]|uniref:Uncharacterized protein n=1 Tax=Pleurodeles waltl TaxID=8319 RepID=A0AAV7P0S5_PLEWA|nr:hypothetical protein NDU88_006917 [Pleurodeles waltl]
MGRSNSPASGCQGKESNVKTEGGEEKDTSGRQGATTEQNVPIRVQGIGGPSRGWKEQTPGSGVQQPATLLEKRDISRCVEVAWGGIGERGG